VGFRRTNQTLHCHITGHLSRSSSEATRRIEECHRIVEGAGNTDSLASDDFSSQSQIKCLQEMKIIDVAYFWTMCCEFVVRGCLRKRISLLKLTFFSSELKLLPHALIKHPRFPCHFQHSTDL
jgi:hypothetical protein